MFHKSKNKECPPKNIIQLEIWNVSAYNPIAEKSRVKITLIIPSSTVRSGSEVKGHRDVSSNSHSLLMEPFQDINFGFYSDTTYMPSAIRRSFIDIRVSWCRRRWWGQHHLLPPDCSISAFPASVFSGPPFPEKIQKGIGHVSISFLNWSPFCQTVQVAEWSFLWAVADSSRSRPPDP